MKTSSIRGTRINIDTVKVRLRIELQEARDEGRTRTELLTALRLPTDLLSNAIEEMITTFELAAHVMRKREFALGRPVTRYWLREYAPADLTPPPPSDIPTDTEEAPAVAPVGSVA